MFPNLTVLENLRIGAYLRKDEDGILKDIQRIYELFPRLEERNWQMAGTLSGGEQQMLALGRALMCRPKLIMMDEPSLGLAPLVIKEIFNIIRRIGQRQGTAGKRRDQRGVLGEKEKVRIKVSAACRQRKTCRLYFYVHTASGGGNPGHASFGS